MVAAASTARSPGLPLLSAAVVAHGQFTPRAGPATLGKPPRLAQSTILVELCQYFPAIPYRAAAPQLDPGGCFRRASHAHYDFVGGTGYGASVSAPAPCPGDAHRAVDDYPAPRFMAATVCAVHGCRAERQPALADPACADGNESIFCAAVLLDVPPSPARTV